jgi:TolB-like protein
VDDIRKNEIALAIHSFENFTADTGMDVVCKSFYIDLTTALSRFSQFRIIANESVEGNSAKYAIKGSFRYQNNILKITAQLLNNDSNRVAWAEHFEGDKESIFGIQEQVVTQIVSNLQVQVNHDLLIRIRKKSPVNFTAYEHFLCGMEEIKKGTLEADEKARVHFNQAIEIDPSYSLAYSGMSLTYFNEWSCQLWERWDLCQQQAFEWAKKAIDLDEQNYVAALVLGRVYLYEAKFEIAENYLRDALRLNPNDVDNLIQIASCFGYLGYLDEAEALYERVLQLNPGNTIAFNHVGAFIAFEKGDFNKAIALGSKAKIAWVDFPATIAAAYYEVGNFDAMYRWWQTFLQEFERKIKKEKADIAEALQWIIDVSPFKGKTNLFRFWEFMGGKQAITHERVFLKATPADKNYFLKEHEIWKISYESKVVLMTEVKGFYDLVKLLEQPDQQIHCTELMGGGIVTHSEFVFDAKAKSSYQKKILALQEEIRWSETNNDLHRTAALHQEYDDIVNHLTSSLGLKGKVRKVNDPLDKTRSAVTWRIRNAIQKIEKVHPMLAKHLSTAIKTGIFNSYSPERPVKWISSK